MMKYISIISLSLFFFTTTTNLAGQETRQTLKALFQKQQLLQEKIYAHTDKEFYLAGETIWFKLYNVDAGFHLPLELSKVAYIEILDAQHLPVLQTKIALQKGTGNGNLQLPESLASGNYIFRTYTNWMKNFDADFYFEKTVTIINTISEEPIKVVDTAGAAFDIQYFPEGGNLVKGLKNKVAFKAVNKDGKGVDFKGALVDRNGDTVSRFQPLFAGIGSFEFVPSADVSYKGIFMMPNGQTVIKDLPKMYERGYVLHVTEKDNGNVLVNVNTNAATEGALLHLFVHTRHQAKEIISAQVKEDSVQFMVHRDSLADGVSHITLFNSGMQPLCERLYFKRPRKKLNIEASSLKHQLKRREKVNLAFIAKDETGAPQAADLSIAVFYNDSSYLNTGADITSYMLLTSDLKGNVESPGYYFSDSTAAVNMALDNLMLTHGWRRFKWKDVLENKNLSQAYQPEFEGPIISGNIENIQTGRAEKNIQTYLAIPGKNFLLYSSTSDSTGRLHYYAKNFYGPVEIVAQAKPGNEKTYRINIETPYSENYSSRPIATFNITSLVNRQLKFKSVNMQVQNIYADKIKAHPHLVNDTVSFYGKSQRTYFLDDYVRFPTMQEVLREYVQEINVYHRNKNFSIALIRKYPNGFIEKRDPLVLIDGVPLLGDQNKIFRYDPLKVKELQIINRDYYLGTSVTQGIANFITYDGRPEGMELEANTTVLDYEGLQMQREFYKPVYETANQVNSRLPDFRSLLLWEPNFKTDNTGKQNISFYTSDLPGKYTVVIQGLSNNGRVGNANFTIEVTNPLFVQSK